MYIQSQSNPERFHDFSEAGQSERLTIQDEFNYLQDQDQDLFTSHGLGTGHCCKLTLIALFYKDNDF